MSASTIHFFWAAFRYLHHIWPLVCLPAFIPRVVRQYSSNSPAMTFFKHLFHHIVPSHRPIFSHHKRGRRPSHATFWFCGHRACPAKVNILVHFTSYAIQYNTKVYSVSIKVVSELCDSTVLHPRILHIRICSNHKTLLMYSFSLKLCTKMHKDTDNFLVIV
jgi:hypothetical protein